jgi:hypothetical protein
MIGFIRRLRPSPGMVVALIALIVALGGTLAMGATSSCPTATPCVNSDDIIDGQVTTPDVANLGITNGKLAASSVTTAKVANAAVTPAKQSTIPAARAMRSSDQTIADDTLTALQWNSENFDTMNLHSGAVNNTRFTAPISGVYEISAGVVWPPNDAGTFRGLWLSVNGEGNCCRASSVVSPVQTGGTHESVSDIEKLAAGDFVEAFVRQTSGGPLNVVGTYQDTFLSMTWIGPG